MKFKKSILALGSLAAIAAPVAAVVSCGVTADSKTYDLKDKNTAVYKAFEAFAVKDANINTAVNDIITGTNIVAKMDAVKGAATLGALADDIKATAGEAQSAIIKKVAGVADNILVVTYKLSTAGTDATKAANYTKDLTPSIQIGFISTAKTLKVLLVTDQGATVKKQFNIVEAAEAKRLDTENTDNAKALTEAFTKFKADKSADNLKALVEAGNKSQDSIDAVANNKVAFTEVTTALPLYNTLAELIK